MTYRTTGEVPPGENRISRWLCLLVGLALWTLVQTLTIYGPIWDRQLPPEADDSQAYLVRTQVMQECYSQDCPALEDLKQQRSIGSSDPGVARAHELSSFPFPFYHPLFSLLILAAKGFTGNVTTAYKALWTLSPALFGAAFAWLLSALWGKKAAGLALGMLAFKIFPDTGLHYLTPSNLAMALAVLLWARTVERRGDAAGSLFVGAILLALTHPIGVIYSLMALTLAVALASPKVRLKVGLAILGLGLVSLTAAVWLTRIPHPPVVNVFDLLDFTPSLSQLFQACASNMEGIVVGISRLKDSLLGEPAVLFAAVSLGLLWASAEQRRSLKRLGLVYAAVLLFAIYPTHAASPPGDLFFRLWIPSMILLSGAVGNALAVAGSLAWKHLRERPHWKGMDARVILQHTWPVPLFALLSGFAAGTALTGGEHLAALSEYMRNRQALSFDSEQVAALLAQAQPGERVLYTATIPMQFYFVNGSLQLGAVYYHPAYAGTAIETEWAARPEVKFVVGTNPLLYHPQLEGLDEKDQCITSPDYRFSPLSRPRRYGPILKESFISAVDFRWLEIRPTTGAPPTAIKVMVRNPGNSQVLQVVPVSQGGTLQTERKATLSVAAHWSGWIAVDLPETHHAESYRLILPQGLNRLAIGGITFGDTQLHWPWEHKAELTLSAKDPATGQVRFEFDPMRLVPPILATRKPVVMDDGGSSVLLGIGD